MVLKTLTTDILPEQDITDGRLTVIVYPSRPEMPLRVKGAQHFKEAQLRREVGVPPKPPIQAIQLDERVNRISRNPYREARLEAEPGGAQGTTALTLTVADRRPFTVFGTLDNQGGDHTDPLRASLGSNGATFWGAEIC